MTEKTATIARRYRRRSAAEIEQLITEFTSSGMSQEEFCQSRDVGRSTLSRYLSLKKNKHQPRPKAATSCLVPVEVVRKPKTAEESGSGLLLVAASGHKVEVRHGFHEATLRKLLDVLERR
jgi:hypothetical protein